MHFALTRLLGVGSPGDRMGRQDEWKKLLPDLVIWLV